MNRLETLKDSRRILVELFDAKIAELEAGEKPEPKLRHGDYGVWNTGEPWLVLLRNDVLEGFGKNTGAGMKANIMPLDQLTCLGNIFDDLKAMQEDVDECRWNYGAEKHKASMDADGSLRISKNPLDSVWVRKEDIPEFILNLRRLAATAERKQ